MSASQAISDPPQALAEATSRWSLIWSLTLPTCLAVGVLAVGLAFYTPHAVLGTALDEATHKGEQTAKQIQTLRSFYSDQIASKTNKPGTLKSAATYRGDPATIPVPTTFILDYAKALEVEGIQIRLVSPYPWPTRAGTVLDDFQKDAWSFLAQNAGSRFTRRDVVGGKEVLRVAVADSMGPSCVSCHNSHPDSPKKDWKVGDARGIIEVVQPLDQAMAASYSLSWQLVLGAIVASLALLGLLLANGFRILAPLRDLIRTTHRLAAGKADGPVPHANRRDELGAVARALQVLQGQQGELAKAKDKAVAAAEAQAQFLANMSHEVRTPLNGVLGYTDLLLDNGTLGPELRRDVERIQTAGSALLTVVNDILDFSEIEAGEIELHPQPFSPVTLVDNAVSIIKSLASKRDLVMQSFVDERLPEQVLGDQDRLRQVLLNILNNAVKFTLKGSISLSVQLLSRDADECEIRFSVQDTGIGILPEKIGELFQRFSQVDSSVRRQFGGTGLGLAISKRLVELMGGAIGVQSAPGQGSTFWFVIKVPIAQTHAGETTARLPHIPKRAARILLADDNEINQDIAKAVLEASGHQVDVVSEGATAVLAVQAKVYDLVLMDVQMPVMDGITATQRIRALDHPARAIPIVAMTANVLPQQVTKFREAGMNDHIGKPFKREELLETIARWSDIHVEATASAA
jgi:signal transduction histidine kinase/ActR/RegA family two-component response regulator